MVLPKTAYFQLELASSSNLKIRINRILLNKKGLFLRKALLFSVTEIYHTLISTSTPEGNSSFINASTVLAFDE